VANIPKVTDQQLQEAVETSISYRQVLLKCGVKPAGGSQSHYKRRIKRLGFNIEHFLGQGHGLGKKSPIRKGWQDILVLRKDCDIRSKANQLRRALVEFGVEYKCSKCGQKPDWLGSPLTLDVDHINQNWLDDRKENLRFLCPNCHSQYSRNLLGS